jgi:hypothetical protein
MIRSNPIENEKAARSAAAADANNAAVFTVTEFGRRRVRALPFRILAGIVKLLCAPFMLAYEALQSSGTPH